MQIIHNTNTDPAFNLAVEEYLMDHADGDIFMLWQNRRSVIIGKNQNAWAEVNVPFAEEHSIEVIRRLTGGGAVFHDLGNINFTFITDADSEGIDFARFAAPVISYLGKLGINARLGGRNDILAEDRKISGNAQCVRTRPDGVKKLMHHGTLLYSADISHMAGVLNVDRKKLVTKGISSVKSRVANLRDISPALADVTPDGFIDSLLAFAEEEYGTRRRGLTADEKEGSAVLAAEKYGTWEWNFGSSPSFSDERSRRFDFGTLTVMFNAEKGIFTDFVLYGDFFGTEDISRLSKGLCGLRVDREEVREYLRDTKNIGSYISGCTEEDLLGLIFGAVTAPVDN